MAAGGDACRERRGGRQSRDVAGRQDDQCAPGSSRGGDPTGRSIRLCFLRPEPSSGGNSDQQLDVKLIDAGRGADGLAWAK